MRCRRLLLFFFFFNDTATTEIYTLSLHDALPISRTPRGARRLRRHRAADACLDCTPVRRVDASAAARRGHARREDRKSTRLNSSHGYISYAVFCLKKKKKTNKARSNALTGVARSI